MKCLYPICNHDVEVFILEPIDARMYCLINEDKALIIDPSATNEVKSFFRDKKIKDITIILTHEHIDHISGVNFFKQISNCKVICSEKCSKRIIDNRKNLAIYIEGMFCMHSEEEQLKIRKLNLLNYTCNADKIFNEQYTFKWEDLDIECIELPGHSPGSIGIIINSKYIFSGDSFIPGEEIITKLPGGNKKAYEKITKNFFKNILLNAIIYPGHKNILEMRDMR